MSRIVLRCLSWNLLSQRPKRLKKGQPDASTGVHCTQVVEQGQRGAMAARGKTTHERGGSEIPASSLDVHRTCKTVAEQNLPGGPVRKL